MMCRVETVGGVKQLERNLQCVVDSWRVGSNLTLTVKSASCKLKGPFFERMRSTLKERFSE